MGLQKIYSNFYKKLTAYVEPIKKRQDVTMLKTTLLDLMSALKKMMNSHQQQEQTKDTMTK
jgi:hypothetical protein